MIILVEQIPFVKSISGDFDRISFIRFDFAERFIIKVFYEFWVNRTDKEISVSKLIGEDFIINALYAPLQCEIHHPWI